MTVRAIPSSAACVGSFRVPGFEVTDKAAMPTRRDRNRGPIALILLPALLTLVVASMRDRLAPRVLLVPHRPLSIEPLEALPTLPSARATTSAGRHPPSVGARSTHPRDAATEPAPRVPVAAVAPYRSTAALADDALDALQGERYDDALAAARNCLLHERDTGVCLGVAAESAVRAGHADDARSYVARCHEAADDEPHCLAASALLAVHDGDLTLAGIATWRLTQVAPASVDTYLARAQLAELQSDNAAAERSYRAACEQGESSACQRLGELMSTAR